MKVSLNWIKQFLDFELPPVPELVERIGAQLGAIEEIENLGEKYQGVIVVRVVECSRLENSDHLNRCLVDDGGKVQGVERNEQGLVQVITGAPNVHKDMLAVWLPPQAIVPETYGKEPFVMQSRPMRGAMSHGMLASARELALSEEHEGILEVDKQARPGDDFATVYKLDDYIIDIENKMFTHRPDCFGALGVAREISGILHHAFRSPEWYQLSPNLPGKTAELPLHVTNELPELVPRFSAVTVADVKLGPSPEWLQVALAKVGQKSINNIVDLTNFYMLVTGQPLHAYDYDKVRALTGGDVAEITVRFPRAGEKIQLLNGKEIEPRSEAIMIASGDHLIGVGGVMGGMDTEVSDATRNLILEAATFDMYSIRRTSMAHGLFTDAVTRFNKGQSPLQTVTVLAKTLSDIQKLADGKLASDLVDVNQVQGRMWVHPPVPVSADFINVRLGTTLSSEDMKQLLENVEFKVELRHSRPDRESSKQGIAEGDTSVTGSPLGGGDDGAELIVTAPFWRTDIEQREDVVEEVGRLYGFDHLPLELPLRSIEPTPKDALLELKSRIREKLVKSGANEVLTYSFVHGNLLEKVGQDKAHAFQISNAISPDLQYYRLSLTPSLLEKIRPNIKAGYDEFALFEMGKSHYKGEMDASDPEVPNEDNHIALVLAFGDKRRPEGAAYYQARNYLSQLVDLEQYELCPLADFDLTKDEWGKQLTAPYEPARSAIILKDDQIWGVVGELRSSVKKALKLPAATAGFEVHAGIIGSAEKRYEPLPRFPKVDQDVCLRVAAEVPYQKVYDLVESKVDELKPDQTRFSVSPVDIYQREDDKDHKQITLRLSIASYEKTMTDEEVARLLDGVAAAAKETLHAERV